MGVPGVPELLIIMVIVAMLFGVGKLPEVFGAVGKGIREFRKESSGEDSASQPVPPEAAVPAAPAAQITTAAPAAAAVQMAPVQAVAAPVNDAAETVVQSPQ